MPFPGVSTGTKNKRKGLHFHRWAFKWFFIISNAFTGWTRSEWSLITDRTKTHHRNTNFPSLLWKLTMPKLMNMLVELTLEFNALCICLCLFWHFRRLVFERVRIILEAILRLNLCSFRKNDFNSSSVSGCCSELAHYYHSWSLKYEEPQWLWLAPQMVRKVKKLENPAASFSSSAIVFHCENI